MSVGVLELGVIAVGLAVMVGVLAGLGLLVATVVNAMRSRGEQR